MTSEIMNNTTKGIVMVVVIFIVILGASIAFSQTIYPWIKEGFVKLDPTELTGSQDNFKILTENIDKCIASQKTNCLCEGLANYPGTFSSKTKLYFTLGGSQTNISLRAGSNVISQENKNVAILSTLLVKSSSDQYLDFNKMINSYDNLRERWLDYSKEPPFFGNKNIKSGPAIISGNFYKKANDRTLSLIFAEKPADVNLTKLNLSSCN